MSNLATVLVLNSTNPPLTLSAAQSGDVILTQNSGLPVFPTNLPVGFTCTIINYSLFPWTPNTLPTPMFVLAGMNFQTAATTFTLKPGQSCVVTVASVNNNLRYFVALGSAS